MPTPACLATASRLASAPPALNTALAASSTRSRLRTASARGFRDVASVSMVISTLCVPLRIEMLRKCSPASMFLFEREFFGKSSLSPSNHARHPPCKAEDASVYGRREPGGKCQLPPRAGARCRAIIALIGALHEPLHQPHRERGAARYRARRPARDAS